MKRYIFEETGETRELEFMEFGESNGVVFQHRNLLPSTLKFPVLRQVEETAPVKPDRTEEVLTLARTIFHQWSGIEIDGLPAQGMSWATRQAENALKCEDEYRASVKGQKEVKP